MVKATGRAQCTASAPLWREYAQSAEAEQCAGGLSAELCRGPRVTLTRRYGGPDTVTSFPPKVDLQQEL